MNIEIPAALERLPADAIAIGEIARTLNGPHALGEFDDAGIASVLRYLDPYRAPRGAEIIREGSTSGFMCYLVDGSMEVVKSSDFGDDAKRLAHIRAGRSIGEMSLIDGLPHSASVVAVEDSTLLLLTEANLARMRDQDPLLAVALLWNMARLMSLRLRQTSDVLVDLLRAGDLGL